MKTYRPRTVPSIDASPLPYISQELRGVSDALTGAAADIATKANKGANSDITSLSGLTTALSVAQGGTGDTGTAWTAFTSTPTCSAGAYTTASASVRYKLIGKTAFFSALFTITALGTATGYPTMTLPFTPVAGFQIVIGYEAAVAGHSVVGRIGGSTMLIVNYDGSPPATVGMQFTLTGVCEIV